MDRVSLVIAVLFGLLGVTLFVLALLYLWRPRIFIRYLRKNSNAQFRVYLMLWRRRILLTAVAPDGEEGLNLERLKKTIKAGRLYHKQFLWRRFTLKILFGLGDPAFTGMAYGGGWALRGVLIPLLFQYFRFDRVPEIVIMPAFEQPGLKVTWEGEALIPLWLWFRLWKRLQ